MVIQQVEITNFRKLRAVRIDLGSEKTLLVETNNSGKSSAMLALRRFLSPKKNSIRITDFTLCHLTRIDELGRTWGPTTMRQMHSVGTEDVTCGPGTAGWRQTQRLKRGRWPLRIDQRQNAGVGRDPQERGRELIAPGASRFYRDAEARAR